MRILLLGPPASGKGTIGRLLGEYFNIPVLSVGKYLRSVSKDSPHYDLTQEVMAKGVKCSKCRKRMRKVRQSTWSFGRPLYECLNCGHTVGRK